MANDDYDPSKWSPTPPAKTKAAKGAPDFDPSKWTTTPPRKKPPAATAREGLSPEEAQRAGSSWLGYLSQLDPLQTTIGRKAVSTVSNLPVISTALRHPVATGAVVGMLYPPALPEVLEATAPLGALTAPAYGALTGAGTQVAADVGGRIGAGVGGAVSKATGIPDLATPLSLLGGGLGAGATEMAVQPWAAEGIAGKGEMTTEAEKAEEAAKTRTLAEEKKAVKGARKEAQAEGTARQAARQKAGQAAATERSQFVEKTMTEQAAARTEAEQASAEAQTRMQEAQRAEQEKYAEQARAAQEKYSKQMRDKARAAYIRDSAAKPDYDAIMEPGPERDARDRTFRQATLGPIRDMRDAWHSERNALYRDHEQVQPSLDPLTQRMTNEEGSWQIRNRDIKPRVRAFWNEVKDKVFPPLPPSDEEALAATASPFGEQTPDSIRKTIEQARRDPNSNAAKMLEQAHRSWQINNPPEPRLNVRDLLKVQQQAKALARAEDGASSVAASQISRGIDESLEPVIPPGANAELDRLNEQYFNHRSRFPYAVEDDLNEFERPLTNAPKIFDHPERALEILKYSKQFENPATEPVLRDLYASMVQENPGWIKRIHAPVLKQLGFTGDLADPESWIYQDHAVNGIVDAVRNNPELAAQLDRLVKDEIGDINDRMAQATVDAARRDARLFGEPLRSQLMAKIRTAEQISPQVAAAEASSFFRDAPQILEQGQPSIEEQLAQQPLNVRQPDVAAAGAESEAARTAPNVARGAVGSFGQPGLRAQFGPIEAEQRAAAVSQLAKGYPMAGTPVWKRWTARAQIWGTVIAGTSLLGRFSGYAIAGLLGWNVIALREMLYKAIRNSMQDPAVAEQVYNSLRTSANTVGRAAPYLTKPNALTRAIARSLYADGMARLHADQEQNDEYERVEGIKKEFHKSSRATAPTGPPSAAKQAAEKYLEQFDPTTTPTATPTPERTSRGPGVKAADRMRAEAIAPSKGSADDAQKLAMNVSKTNPINIHRALTSGRHSTDEIKQTLQLASNARAGDVLAGIPLPEAMSAVEMADPAERQMLMPILLQRLKQEMPRIQNATTQSNLTQRMKRLQQMQPTGATALA